MGLTAAILELTKPEADTVLKMQREKEKVEGGGIQSLGTFLGVFLKKQTWIFQASTWNISKEMVTA